ncbi:anti-repressor SinI family protein [Metabacillus niabensis]|uniref:DNA-binding transcriptional MerR regulator n=1 Tax=Metabacillus niabensis TaxID=324854 RepID=A0ABT9Z033_9BACI|nr:DNA-binding transcriptional MerR regulator [Metabacillus niabensis]PAD69451.1 hypothetical protein CHH83_08550 [Bacillus sp. 7586-K]
MNSELIDKIKKDGQLDREWVEMILEALELGISIEEIKEFFSKAEHPPK